jgi:hypothetical protein
MAKKLAARKRSLHQIITPAIKERMTAIGLPVLFLQAVVNYLINTGASEPQDRCCNALIRNTVMVQSPYLVMLPFDEWPHFNLRQGHAMCQATRIVKASFVYPKTCCFFSAMSASQA